MGALVRARMAAAKTRERGRVVRRSQGRHRCMLGSIDAARRHERPVDEVPSRDSAHASNLFRGATRRKRQDARVRGTKVRRDRPSCRGVAETKEKAEAARDEYLQHVMRFVEAPALRKGSPDGSATLAGENERKSLRSITLSGQSKRWVTCGSVSPNRELTSTWVTLHSGDMGNTFSFPGRKKCHGRSATKWKNVSGSSRDCLMGEKMAALCREFDISRKTGYKIFNRYKDSGLEGLTDRSRRPYRHANQLPFQVEQLIVQLKKDKPNWGAPKIRERLRRLHPNVHTPAISTVHAVLDRHGMVKRRRRRRHKAQGTALSRPRRPNELWCTDYKGEFMLADRRYCYPLTITDYASRYLIACDALATTKEGYAFTVFERAFKDFGLPLAIRTDNGVPFSCCQRLVRSEPPLRLVATPRHRHRAHQAGPPSAERAARAHAPDLEARSHQARRLPTSSAAASQVRRLHRLLQQRAPPPGARHALPR